MTGCVYIHLHVLASIYAENQNGYFQNTLFYAATLHLVKTKIMLEIMQPRCNMEAC